MRWSDHTADQRSGFTIWWAGNGALIAAGGIFMAVVGEFGWALFGLALGGLHFLVLGAAMRYGDVTLRNVRRLLNDFPGEMTAAIRAKRNA